VPHVVQGAGGPDGVRATARAPADFGCRTALGLVFYFL